MLSEQSVFLEPYERLFKDLPPDLLHRRQAVIYICLQIINWMIANAAPDTTQARTRVSLSLIRTKDDELNFETKGREMECQRSRFSGGKKEARLAFGR
jgi:hypothetical protein